ncbi:MAG: histidinol dehydrogenase [Spirochaetales bacterium]|nr:histidinol dehydrogenase [Spirochaetales bacterium]
MKIIEYDKDQSQLDVFLNRGKEVHTQVEETVKKIVERVKKEGDKALFSYTRELDGVDLTVDTFKAGADYFSGCAGKIDPDLLAILKEARDNIRAFHENQKQESWLKDFPDGVKLGQRILPINRVGVYVPGGRAFYPSSVLMNIIPAQIAGVKEIIAVTPPGKFFANPVIGATLSILGVDTIRLAGGAQAVAALAFGTESVPRVDKIVGPGNIYVALAKREVFGYVDIDMIAGPSEVVVIAQDNANPEWVALDLLSQAEHRTGFESAILVTDSPGLAGDVNRYMEAFLKEVDYGDKVRKILDDFGAIFIVPDIMTGAAIVNEIAPEHLEIIVKNEKQVLDAITNAGAVFMGQYSSEPVGDYWAGTNHILPTGGTARFFSPLGVYDFVKKSSLIYYSKEALMKHAVKINRFAQEEDLYFHGKAVLKRYEDLGKKDG